MRPLWRINCVNPNLESALMGKLNCSPRNLLVPYGDSCAGLLQLTQPETAKAPQKPGWLTATAQNFRRSECAKHLFGRQSMHAAQECPIKRLHHYFVDEVPCSEQMDQIHRMTALALD